MLLAPGAGADRTQPALVAIDDALTAAGARVRRMDFPYRLVGRRAPDRLPVLVEAVADEARRLGAGCARLVLGGRSMGGRVCSVAVAEGADLGAAPVAGLALVSYPLHPPGRPDRRRDAHLPGVRVPCLFVSGTRDAFGTVTELEEAAATIPAPVTCRWIDGGDHGLRRRDAEVAGIVTMWAMSALA